MKEISVKELAKILGTPEEKILSQMKEAGLNQTLSSDLVTDQDKQVLLDFLKGQQDKAPKTISLKKKKSSESSEKQTTIAIKRKKITTTEIEEDVKDDSKRIDFEEIEKKRIEGEEFKKSEEERRQRESEKKVSVKRKPKPSQTVVKRTKPSLAPKIIEKKKRAQKDKVVVSKKELKELEGEEFLSKEEGKISEHRFEKPVEFVVKDVKIPEAISEKIS